MHIGEPSSKVSIVVPTYNERENVAPLYEAIREKLEGRWDYELIFVDDNSPDGTATVIERLTAEDPRVQLLQRPGKLGLGSAVAAGFRLALGGYWVMMDADLSHDPRHLPVMLDMLAEADIVVGSRYVPGGGIDNWPRWRRFSSWLANIYGRAVVGLAVRDVTSGYAAFRRPALEPLLPGLDPKGFKLLLEVISKSNDASVKEVPIRFVDRLHGRSKFGLREVETYLGRCWAYRRERRQRVTVQRPG